MKRPALHGSQAFGALPRLQKSPAAQPSTLWHSPGIGVGFGVGAGVGVAVGTGVGEGAPLLAFALCISTNLVFSIFPPASIFRFVIPETFASVSIVINAQLSSGSFRTRTVTCTTCPNRENRAFSATSDASVRSIFPTCRV